MWTSTCNILTCPSNCVSNICSFTVISFDDFSKLSGRASLFFAQDVIVTNSGLVTACGLSIVWYITYMTTLTTSGKQIRLCMLYFGHRLFRWKCPLPGIMQSVNITLWNTHTQLKLTVHFKPMAHFTKVNSVSCKALIVCLNYADCEKYAVRCLFSLLPSTALRCTCLWITKHFEILLQCPSAYKVHVGK